MKFLDLARVYIRSGSGGAGAVSFRREKFIEYGGPDGGDGGHGGSVIAECVDGLNTLIDFRYQQHFFAKNGGSGMGQQRTGARGDDVILQNVLVVEKKPDRVEIVPLQKVEVPSDAVLLEAVWRAAVRLRSKPIDALDREGLRVGVYVAIAPDKVEAVLRDGVGVERGLYVGAAPLDEIAITAVAG